MEPLHIHVRKGEAIAKFWIHTHISIAEAYGIQSSKLRELMRVTEENRELIERFWNEHFDL